MSYGQQLLQLSLIFLRLGLTSFGGPVAHLGYFHHEFVVRRAWYSEQSYADMVALCQFLPGPTSSQVGIMIGLQRAGYVGACVAWAAFTLPSAVLLVLFALGVQQSFVADAGWLQGLKLAAVAVVIHAVLTMMRGFSRSAEHVCIMAVVAGVLLWSGSSPASVYVLLLLSALYGMARFSPPALSVEHLDFSISRRMGWCSLAALLLLWWGLTLWAQNSDSLWVAVITVLYQSATMVFGGGHVVLALLQENVASYVPQFSDALLLAGYGAAQAVPGPLFSIGAYIGAVAIPTQALLGALIGIIAIFLPAFLVVFAVVPFWLTIRRWRRVRGAFSALTAAVVGVLVAVLYDPLWLNTVHTLTDWLVVAIACFLLLVVRWSPIVVILCAVLSLSLI